MTAAQHAPVLPPLVDPAPGLEPEELDRYSRHILLPEIGRTGQRRLKNARVLVVGAGGLGSPVLLYLAAAGIGTLGIIDDDRVEASNLQRQIIHGVADMGRLKVDSARDALIAVNPLITVECHPRRLSAANAVELFEQYDLVVDGADNFATRYLVSDAATLTGTPCVWGSILRFGAQVSVFWNTHGPTYRDLYPDSPPPESAPSCGEAGVLGMLCGVAGSMMAAEVVKLVTGSGSSLLGRLSIFDLGHARWQELRFGVDPARRPVTRLDPGAEDPGPEDCGPEDCGPENCGRNDRAGGAPAIDRFDEITAAELDALLRERSSGGALFELVDVREDDESALLRIPGSRSAPLSRLRRQATLDGTPFDAPLIVYCKAGPRSRSAARILRDAGYTDIRVLEGGIDDWVQARVGETTGGAG